MLSFVLLLFFSFSFLVFTSSLFPAEWQQYIEQKVKVWISLSLGLSPLLILNPHPPSLLSSLLLLPCICLSRCIPPFVYLFTPIHLFHLCLPPHTASLSLCPSPLLLSTAHKIQREMGGKLNKETEMYSEGNNLINTGCLVTVNNVVALASQCPRCD